VQTVQTPVKTANVVKLDATEPLALFMRHTTHAAEAVIICPFVRLRRASHPLSLLSLGPFGTQAGLGTMVTGISDGGGAYGE